jgi:hypothetical protein
VSEFDKTDVTHAKYIVTQADARRRHIERIKVKTLAKPIVRVREGDM